VKPFKLLKEKLCSQDMNTGKRLISAAKTATIPVMIMWIIHIVKLTGNFQWGKWGVFPRQIEGVYGIITAPWIHGDFPHLLSNSVPVFFLTTLILFFYQRVAVTSLIMLYLLTGALVWVFARPVYHIGASGVVYAMVSFVFWNGIFRRNMKSVVLALVVTVMYSGYFAGIVPGEVGISWESHLLGAISGIIVSFFMKNNIETDEVEEDPWKDDDYTPKDYFLDRDAFDQPKNQRNKDYFS